MKDSSQIFFPVWHAASLNLQLWYWCNFYYHYYYSGRITLQARDSNTLKPTIRAPLKKRKSEVHVMFLIFFFFSSTLLSILIFLWNPLFSIFRWLESQLSSLFQTLTHWLILFPLQPSKKKLQPAAKKQSYEIQVSLFACH